jgi:hypothetical protein
MTVKQYAAARTIEMDRCDETDSGRPVTYFDGDGLFVFCLSTRAAV